MLPLLCSITITAIDRGGREGKNNKCYVQRTSKNLLTRWEEEEDDDDDDDEQEEEEEKKKRLLLVSIVRGE